MDLQQSLSSTAKDSWIFFPLSGWLVPTLLYSFIFAKSFIFFSFIYLINVFSTMNGTMDEGGSGVFIKK